MIVVPAVDLREGCCVQLRGGAYDDELVRLEDPVGVAVRWRDRGARELHVVDLDAATGRGENRAVVAEICALEGLAVHVGGGVRDDEDVARTLRDGAASALVATRAVEDPDWLAAMASAHPGRLSLAVDVRDGAVTTRGWTEATRRDVVEVVTAVDTLALFAVVVTAVDVEGRQVGPDLELVTAVRAATRHRLGYAGGVATRDDLAALRTAGADAVVVGTALYTGALDLEGLSEEVHP